MSNPNPTRAIIGSSPKAISTGFFSTTVFKILIFTMVMGSLFAAAYLYVTSGSDKSNNINIREYAQNSLSDAQSFYITRKRKPVDKQVTDEEILKQVEENKLKSKRAKVQKTNNKTKKNKLTTSKKQNKFLNAPLTRNTTIRHSSQVNRLRDRNNISGGVITVTEREVIYENSQDDWGLAKDKASFPVDLTRTISIDKNIPCSVIEEIDTTLGGKIRCSINRPVYSSHGRNVLIPPGSTGVGFYQPLNSIGDTRLNVVWTRIITPTGVNINTTNNATADRTGQVGITGDIDNRFWERYGAAFVISTINLAAIKEIRIENQFQGQSLQAYGGELANIAKSITDRGAALAPKIYLPQGAIINMTPTTDIWFPKPNKKIIKVRGI